MRRRTRYVLLLVAIFVIGGLILRSRLRAPAIRKGSYLVLDISGAYTEEPPEDLVGHLLSRRQRTLIDLLTMIRTAQADTRIAGMIARIRLLETGWAKGQDIRDALLQFKTSGKPLLALLEQEASGSNLEYYLASVADKIYLSPNVAAPLNGLSSNFVFLGGVWEKLDIQMTVEKIREYKTAGDMIANKEMTAAHREMANWLLDSLETQFVDGLAQGRHLDPAAIRAVIDKCPISPADFEAAGLSNGTRYLEDLHAELGGEQAPFVEMKDYAQVNPTSVGLDVGPEIGVVYGVGVIVSGESGTSVQGQTLGADTLIEALKDAAKDDDVRAIVFRVDSPGGSALASDLVWRATQDARKKKPVIVSMSDVAGSGGYYIAAGANWIVAQPGTLTGSIGVVSARPNVKGFLKRLGVNTETISRGTFADLNDVTTPLTPQGRRKLLDEIDFIYGVFVDRVSSGRNLSTKEVDQIGAGRVWTGAQAKDKGLVDELGGFVTAIQAAKRVASIGAREEVHLVFYPRRKGIVERLGDLLNGATTIELPRSWQNALRSLALPFDEGSLLTLMPETVEIH